MVQILGSIIDISFLILIKVCLSQLSLCPANVPDIVRTATGGFQYAAQCCDKVSVFPHLNVFLRHLCIERMA